MVHFFNILKMAFFVALLSACFFGFGLPCINRFFADEITVNEFVTKNTSLKPPAITICPLMWKNDSPPIMPFGHYKKNCGDASSAKEFSDCVKNKTLNLNEVVVNATQGFSSNIIKKLELSDSDLWTSDMTISVSGRCYTLNYDKQLKVDKETNSIIINLVPTNYYLFLHDPDFFFPTINPRTLPLNLIMVNPQELGNTSYLTLTIEVIQKQNLNRAEVPCNHSPGYNFTACIKRSLARMVNCTLPWNDEIRGFEVCSNMDQFEKYESLYWDLAKKDKCHVENTTGCLYPCSYHEYRVADKQVQSGVGMFGVFMYYGSVAVSVKKEVYDYTFVSFVSDFGGTLGLFIGFSFFGLWDIFKDFALAVGHLWK